MIFPHFFGLCIYVVISKDACVGTNFAYHDIGFGIFLITFTMWVIRNLLGWFNCDDGFLTWLRSRFMLFGQYVRMLMSIAGALVCSISSSITYNSTLRTFGYLGMWAM